jgi:hypothetical protein
MGSGDNGEWTFLDILSLISFCISLQNLKLNIAQEDLDNQTKELDKDLRQNVDDIHGHLAVQDEKLNIILKILKENGGVLFDKDKEIS